jgi:tagaturonate reductase
MVLIPCELIDRNGDNLRRTILQFAEHWRLPQTFSAWVKQHNVFLNTLVDRVVTGYPRDEIQEITAALGYEDLLVDAGELFHLWVIEGPKELAERLPFDRAGLHVIWTDDLAPHRTRKVRVLNGAHTSCAPAAFLYGVDTVGEMMADGVAGKFVRQIIRDEIVLSIDLDKTMLMEYADEVIKRFQNPFITHDLRSILLNSSSKFKTRVLPSLLEYQRSQGSFPRKLTFSLAALIAVYRGGTVTGDAMQACRDKGGFIMKDDRWALEFFAGAWADYGGSAAAAKKLAVEVLENVRLWGEDLNALVGFADAVAQSLYSITSGGIQRAMADLTR